MEKNSINILNEFKNELWLKEIQKSQDHISMSSDTNRYYVTDYRDTEISYWSHIPKWIMQLKNQNVKNCLDIGGAYGTLAIFCKNIFDCNVYVTDFVDIFLNKVLLKENDITFSVNNIELDKFPWNVKFDLIILTEILEHFNFQPVPTLKKIYSLLSDDGHLFLSTPDSSEWGITTQYYDSLEAIPKEKSDNFKIIDDHVWQYNKSELLYVLDEAGFIVENLEYSKGIVGRHFNLELRKKPNSFTTKDLENEIKTKLEVINYLKSESKKKLEKLVHLQNELNEKTTTIEKLNFDINLKDNEISKQNLELNNIKNELDNIKKSRSYKIAQIYGKKFAGTRSGSVVEKMFDYIINKNKKNYSKPIKRENNPKDELK